MKSMMELIQRAQKGEKEIRDRLVAENLGLVYAVVKRFENRGHEKEELFQIGSIGLMKAIDKFDTSLGLAFSTYAVPMIMGEIRRFLRDDGMIKVSRTLKEQAGRLKREKEQFEQENGREPDLKELSDRTGLTVEDMVLAMEANSKVESIYQTVYQEKGDELLLIDHISGENTAGGSMEELINKIFVQELLGELEEKERRLLEYRYFDGLTQTETAKKLNTNQVQVSRMEKRLLLNMRRKLQKEVT